MRIFISRTANRLFKVFLVVTIGIPSIAALLLWSADFFYLQINLPSLGEIITISGLVINWFFFYPIHLVFGSNYIPIGEFGPYPGMKGYLIAILSYGVIDYLLANVLGTFFRQKGAS